MGKRCKRPPGPRSWRSRRQAHRGRGRYECRDGRIHQHLVTDMISIGDYMLTGGELPALVLIDAAASVLQVVFGDPEAVLDNSYPTGMLEFPHYTRPPEFRCWKIPDVLLSCNHDEIARWRRQQPLHRTLRHSPDLLTKASLDQEDLAYLREKGYQPNPNNSPSKK